VPHAFLQVVVVAYQKGRVVEKARGVSE
jgi:hypothetical protein